MPVQFAFLTSKFQIYKMSYTKFSGLLDSSELKLPLKSYSIFCFATEALQVFNKPAFGCFIRKTWKLEFSVILQVYEYWCTRPDPM